MKKAIAIILCSFLLSVIPILAVSKSKTQKRPEPDWDILNAQKWDEAFYKLVPPPTEDGNAATYFLKAIHNRFCCAEGQKRDIYIYPWLKDINFEILESDKPEDIELINKAVQIPELDDIVKAGMQKNYQIYGINAPLTQNVGNIGPEYLNILKMSDVLTARADKKLAAGDAAGAETDMLATIRAGHILQKDVSLIGYMVGRIIELRVANEMPDFYKNLKREDKVQEWVDFAQLAEKHRDEVRNFSSLLISGNKDELMKITDDPTLPRSFRMASFIHIVEKFAMDHPIRAYLFGLPKDRKTFAVKKHFEDPEMVIFQFKIIENANIGIKTRRHAPKELKQ